MKKIFYILSISFFVISQEQNIFYKYADVKITKDIVAAIHGSMSYPSNRGTPKPHKNKSIKSGTDWNNQT